MKMEESVSCVYLFPQLYRRLRVLTSLFSPTRAAVCSLKKPSLSLHLVSCGNFMARVLHESETLQLCLRRIDF